MSEFIRPDPLKISARHSITGKVEEFEFDSYDSTISLIRGNNKIKIEVPPRLRQDSWLLQSAEYAKSAKESVVFDKEHPVKKSPGDAKFILIRMGSKCNYQCTYCAQTLSATDSEETIGKSVAGELYATDFIKKFPEWYKGGTDGKGNGTSVMFYGGEPFVYWKNMKLVVDFLRSNYPNMTLNVTTNGSILDREKVDYIKKNFQKFTLSHDGPGQKHRHETDFLDDDTHRKYMQELSEHFGVNFRFSVVLSKNVGFSRVSVNAYCGEKFGRVFNVAGGHIPNYFGEFLEETSFETTKEAQEYAKRSYEEIRTGTVNNFDAVSTGVRKMFVGLLSHTPITVLSTTRCNFDLNTQIAVDIEGNFLTCGNVSATDIADNGTPHLLGNASNVDDVYLATGKHPLADETCRQCPVLLSCLGGCFFFDGKIRERNCLNMYYGYMGIFAHVFEQMTNHVPFYIDHPSFPEYKKDIFGEKNSEFRRINNKVFSIKEI